MEQNPLAKYELRRVGGSARNTEGMFTNINGNAARDARRAAKRDARPMTYAEMQNQGIARPAPPMPSSTDNLGTMFVGDQMANLEDAQTGLSGTPAVYGDTSKTSGKQLASATLYPGTSSAKTFTGSSSTPTGVPGFDLSKLPTYDPDVYNKLRSAAVANLEAQFTAQRQQLEDSLASRGLSASSFGAGSLGDLYGQQARALATLDAQLLADEDNRQRAMLDLYLKMLPVLAAGNSSNTGK